MPLIAAERIEIQVIVDNVLDMLSSTPSFETRETQQLLRRGMKRTTGGAPCCAGHGLSLLIPAHCTGWRAVNALERAYGAAVVPAAVGKMFTLEAA